jgi:hypothetical protein
VFEAERRALIDYPGPFDGFHETDVSVSKTSLVRFDRNRYSVANKAVGQTVQVHAYADRILIRLGGEVVARGQPPGNRRPVRRSAAMLPGWRSAPAAVASAVVPGC